jgi:hypothetical protein
MTVFLKIKCGKEFNDNILPKIDELAAEQNITDIIRDILYASASYKPGHVLVRMLIRST